ncbi:MAG: TolC family protein, partial [Muribaculaceae bacterium]|nr:TolC family protein [Muribaculaceae bacterium]
MKSKIFLSCVIAIAPAIAPAALTGPADTVPAVANESAPSRVLVLSKKECIAIALQESPTVKVADLEVKRMDYSKKETRAALFPTVDFQGTYQRAIELQTIRMNMGGQSQSLKMGSDNTWNLGFNASMPLVAPQLWK